MTTPNLKAMSTSPQAFRESLLIERDGRLVRFGDVVNEYQKADFAACDSGWARAAGHAVSEPVTSNCWLERPRGHSKTTDLAISLLWFVAFSRKLTRAYAAAADRDQARLLRDAAQKIVAANPWLCGIVEIQNNRLINIASGDHPGAGSALDVLSADVGSSYGLTPDAIICDELTHWAEGAGEQLWHSLISSAAKRSSCFLMTITNAGRFGTWQHKAREHARQSPRWHFNSLNGPAARWISAETLEEQRKQLPPTVYARLWLNQWVSGGDALPADDIQASVTCDGPMSGTEDGWKFVGGLDLGISRDHSALVILGANRHTQRIRLALVQSWKPPAGGMVDLESVKASVIDANRRFRLKKLIYDPYQAVLLASQLQKAGVKCEEMPFIGANLNRMAGAVLEMFRSRKIDLYPDDALMKDLSELAIVEKSYGFRLEAARTAAGGHGDRGTALAICAPAAMELLRKRQYDLEAWLNAGCLQ